MLIIESPYPGENTLIHFAFLFHLFALMIGGIAISAGLLRYLNYRNPLILKFTAVLLGTELIMMGLATTLYGTIVSLNLYPLSRTLDSMGVVLLSLSIPQLILPLFAFPPSKTVTWIHRTACTLIILFLLGYYLLDFPEITARIGQTLFFLTITSPIILALHRRKKFIGSSHFKRSLHLLFISFALVMPLVIFDATGFAILPHDISVGLLMLLLCINGIRIVWSDLARPLNATFAEKISLFCERNELSPREKDIVEALSEGLTNREIGDLLFISPKTVEHHLTKIYAKSEVENRYQLIQQVSK